jgi:hypothetical protein
LLCKENIVAKTGPKILQNILRKANGDDNFDQKLFLEELRQTTIHLRNLPTCYVGIEQGTSEYKADLSTTTP